jgi:hypothetical protein
LRVVDLDAFERFMRLVAARTGQELNLSALAGDAGITQPTAKHWLTAIRSGTGPSKRGFGTRARVNTILMRER